MIPGWANKEGKEWATRGKRLRVTARLGCSSGKRRRRARAREKARFRLAFIFNSKFFSFFFDFKN
jgi:hypothetical protein